MMMASKGIIMRIRIIVKVASVAAVARSQPVPAIAISSTAAPSAVTAVGIPWPSLRRHIDAEICLHGSVNAEEVITSANAANRRYDCSCCVGAVAVIVAARRVIANHLHMPAHATASTSTASGSSCILPFTSDASSATAYVPLSLGRASAAGAACADARRSSRRLPRSSSNHETAAAEAASAIHNAACSVCELQRLCGMQGETRPSRSSCGSTYRN